MSKKASKKKVEKLNARKWIPAVAGIGSTLIVLVLLNSQLIASTYIGLTYKPVDASSQDIQTAEHKIDENAPSKIIINNIEVEAPIDFSQEVINETSFQESLKNGVVHYPFTANPGETGNVVIFGHSSGQVWAPGDYKFIFSKLEHLAKGNKIFIDYKGIRYEYEVNETKIVPPTDVSVLQSTPDNRLTLITCYPVGSNAKRLIVIAKQVSPQPTQEQKKIEPPKTQPTSSLPGNNKSIWQTIKSVFN